MHTHVSPEHHQGRPIHHRSRRQSGLHDALLGFNCRSDDRRYHSENPLARLRPYWHHTRSVDTRSLFLLATPQSTMSCAETAESGSQDSHCMANIPRGLGFEVLFEGPAISTGSSTSNSAWQTQNNQAAATWDGHKAPDPEGIHSPHLFIPAVE